MPEKSFPKSVPKSWKLEAAENQEIHCSNSARHAPEYVYPFVGTPEQETKNRCTREIYGEEKGQDNLKRLVKEADVVLENFKPGTLREMNSVTRN